MQAKLTPIAKVLIALAIGAGIFFGGKYFLSKKNTDTTSDSKTINPNSNSTANASKVAFSYVPPEPINGVLKGVVELGASGFNSFIVRIDKSKNWKLDKASFGNSLVLENMATETDIREGLKKYIGAMLDYGVASNQIHFVVSSGAAREVSIQKIIISLKALKYFVNTVSPEQEGALALNCVLPKDYEKEAFVVDIGSSNTKVSWKVNNSISAFETYGSKYFQDKTDDGKVFGDIKAKCTDIPIFNRKACFIIGGVPFKLATVSRKDKERFTVLNNPDQYKMQDAKEKSGINIYKAIKDGTSCPQFIFDWDANFSIGYLLGLP